MPTYDYLCRNCGHEGEYRNVPRESHPNCLGCGSNENMHRMPSTINIGGVRAREACLEDTLTPQIRLNSVSKVEAECEAGHKHPGLLFEFEIKRSEGPCLN